MRGTEKGFREVNGPFKPSPAFRGRGLGEGLLLLLFATKETEDPLPTLSHEEWERA